MMMFMTFDKCYCKQCDKNSRAYADITAKGVSKAKGLNEIAHWREFDMSQTMAFGDGGNDIAIVKEAGIGVAMGNANDSLKEVADYVASSVDDDGIFNALKYFGVISELVPF